MISPRNTLELDERLASDRTKGTYLIDTLRSRVGFSVRHLTGRVRGAFGHVSGIVIHDSQRPEATSVRITIQSASVTTHSIPRDVRLRSAGFLDVRAFPEITFVSTVARRLGRKLEVIGELTLHGVSRPVTVNVGRTRTSPVAMGRDSSIGASARALVPRLEFGVGPSSELAIGGLLIGDEVAVEIDLEFLHP